MSVKPAWHDLMRREDGGVAIPFCLGVVMLVAFAGVAIDYSRATHRRTDLQVALDSSVLAGAVVPTKKDSEKINAATTTFAARGGGATPNFSISSNVLTGTATASLDTGLLRAVGIDNINVSAQSAAAFTPKSPPCLLLLEKTGIGLYANSDAKVTGKECGVQANSTDKEAIYVNSKGKITAESVCAVGGIKMDSSSAITPAPKDRLSGGRRSAGLIT